MKTMLLFDLLLVLLILGLAWRCVSSRDLFESVVLFIALGLLIAMAWVRLQAPDAALAEVAIGSGLAGALLLASVSRLPQQVDLSLRPFAWGWNLAWLGLGVGLFLALAQLPASGEGLMPQVAQSMAQSGVEHPVTAVLLNFRAWDTLLELAVLAWAWFAQRALGSQQTPHFSSLQGQVLQTTAKWLAPFILMVGAYLLWRGAASPGGAFQAGAVLAAGLVMYRLAHNSAWPMPRGSDWWLRLMWVGGFWLFALIGFIGALLGFGFMGYAPTHAGHLIMLIEVFATLSIAFLLAAMFSGESHIVTLGEQT
jgi:multisubunit Na+/H+ antiporter MnhB subunit